MNAVDAAQTRAYRTAIGAELTANRDRVAAYAAALRNILFELMDAEQFEMADWEWQWPEHAPPALSSTSWDRGRAALLPAQQEIVDRAYLACREVPPSLAAWEAAWDGEPNTFLAFALDRLDEWRDRLIAAIRLASEGVTGG